jgi:hypothetical protein
MLHPANPAPVHFGSAGTGAMLIALFSAAVGSNMHGNGDKLKYGLQSAANKTQCVGFCL